MLPAGPRRQTGSPIPDRSGRVHPNPDFQQRYAFTVAETGGMTSASRVLNLTQAAVSLQVKRLEETLGCQLFERDRRGLRLTGHGERLVAHADRLLRSNDEVWALMSAPAFEGEVRLGMPSDIVRPYAPPVLRRFEQAWPRVRVSLVCDTSGRLLEKLDRGEIDLAMTVQTSCGPHGESLLTSPLVWVGALNGNAFERYPLPISTGDETCPHRPVALKALYQRPSVLTRWRFPSRC